jgi:hypothetical protein
MANSTNLSSMPATFKVGELYSNAEIQNTLSVGNAGGVRVRLDDQKIVKRLVVTTSRLTTQAQSENPYRDRIEGDILTYTGAGRSGDQTLGGVNQRIPQQTTFDFPIYGFEMIGSRRDRSLGPKRWRFIGLLEYLRHYSDQQIDVSQALRKVWLFEFRILPEPREVAVDLDHDISRLALRESRDLNATIDSDREISDDKQESRRFSPAELETVRRQFLELTPESFEHRLCDLLVATGFENVAVTRYSQDGGIDVNAAAGAFMWPIWGLHIQLQAKRWLHTVGRKDVAELRGSLQPFARGAVVTTSHFSRAAVQEATEAGKNPIILVDGIKLAEIALSLDCK